MARDKDTLVADLNRQFLISTGKCRTKYGHRRDKLVFFPRIPRCGSTFIREFLKKTIPTKHILTPHGSMSTGIWDGVIKNGLKSSVSFAVIRNPYDLLLSHFLFSSKERTGPRSSTAMKGFYDIRLYMSTSPAETSLGAYKEFVRNFCNLEYKPEKFAPFRKWMNFCHFLPSGDPGVQYLIRQESLNKGLLEMFVRIEKKANSVHHTSMFNLDKTKLHLSTRKRINPTKEKENGYKKWYDPEMIEWMEERFGRELKAFNYSFDGPLDDHSLLSASAVVYNPITDVLIS